MVIARVIETVAIDNVAPPGCTVVISPLFPDGAIWFFELPITGWMRERERERERVGNRNTITGNGNDSCLVYTNLVSVSSIHWYISTVLFSLT